MSLESGFALSSKKVSARGWSAVEAAPKQKPVIIPESSRTVRRENPSYQPRLLDQPMSARPASHPYPRRFASRTGIAEAVQSLVGRLWVLHDPRQVEGPSFYGLCTGAHEAVELRAVGQGRECVSEMTLGVAVEVSLAVRIEDQRAKIAKVMSSLSAEGGLVGRGVAVGAGRTGRNRPP